MNNKNQSSKDLITLELLAQRKAEKLEEVRKAKERIHHTARQLFAPVEPKNGMDSFMQNINSGMAIYDGVMTGIKIMRRVRSFFMKKKK